VAVVWCGGEGGRAKKGKELRGPTPEGEKISERKTIKTRTLNTVRTHQDRHGMSVKSTKTGKFKGSTCVVTMPEGKEKHPMGLSYQD